MTECVAQWFAALPKEWVVFVISMLPIVELRGAIPWALSPAMGPALSWSNAYLIAVAGNLMPVIPILRFLEPVSLGLRRRGRLFDRFFTWLFARTGIPLRLALPCICLGVAIAGCVVTLASLGVFHMIGL
jgi:uncharacterized membrane protein